MAVTGSATYNTIVVTAEPRGRFEEGLVSGALKPGVVVEVAAATEPVCGRFTFGSAAIPLVCSAVLCEDWTQGRTPDTAYTSGDQGRIYWPIPGDDLMMRCADGTYAIGDPLNITTGGVLTADTGTLGPVPFVCMETWTSDGNEVFLLVKYSGR